ncbi:hypothetical protein GmRootA79_28440 [Acidovorax sp. A79]|uniref:metallophosphoesterase family protein n=1 Tax=unclassified Acidovorax TaxID=2684926 RepID=UPI00351D56B3
MRMALVSDIHGNLAALEAVAADIRRRGADQVVNLGDNLQEPVQGVFGVAQVPCRDGMLGAVRS